MPPRASTPLVLADSGTRLIAFFIDWLLELPLLALHFIPLVGSFMTFLVVPYWLFRDHDGASVGKRVLGLRVVDYQGNTAQLGPRLVRNLIFAIPLVFGFIPVFGPWIGLPAFFACVFVELISLFTTGQRISDKLAKCLVVKTV